MNKERIKCSVCGKNSAISSGWHLEGDLNFCSSDCVAYYIEKVMNFIIKDLNSMEKRIVFLERKAGLKK